MVHKDYTNNVFGWGRSERSIEECGGIYVPPLGYPFFQFPKSVGGILSFVDPFFFLFFLNSLFPTMFSQNYNFILNLTRSNILSNLNQVIL